MKGGIIVMNIIFGWIIIAFSAFLVFKYKPRTLDSFILLAMTVSTGIINASSVSPSGIFVFILQVIVIVCCTVQLRYEFKLRKPSVPKSIRVTTENRGINRRNETVNNLPIVTA